MSFESVAALDPRLFEPNPGRPRPLAAARRLARRLGAIAGRWPLAGPLEGSLEVLGVRITGATGPADVAGALREVVGADCPVSLRLRERLPSGEPLLVLVFHEGRRRAPRATSTPALSRIVRESCAAVVPVLVREEPRRALLGTPIPAERIARIEDDGALAGLLAARAAVLRHRPARAAAPAPTLTGAAPVARAAIPDLVAAEIEGLPAEQRLVESGRFVVVHARAHQAPACLREVGRLREITFRAAGEGTGRDLDLDAHDRIYSHLVLFDREARCVAGAYRFAPTDEVLPVFGVQGLYTNTLFSLDPRLFLALGPALELGRSFVRTEYQRAYAPLLLLWRGLCGFISRNPRYRILFGAVSISASYGRFSRALVAQALSQPGWLHPLARYATPRHPLAVPRAVRGDLGDLPRTIEDAADLSDLVSDAEDDAKGLPVLLREYLKLGGRMLGFSVDPAFSGVLDGLVAVDLARSDRRRLDAIMGRDAAQAFVAHHAVDASPECVTSTAVFAPVSRSRSS